MEVRFQEEATIHYQQYLFMLLERYLSCMMFKTFFPDTQTKIQYWNHVVNIPFYGKTYAGFR